jgi:hypothetical protein
VFLRLTVTDLEFTREKVYSLLNMMFLQSEEFQLLYFLAKPAFSSS